MDSFVALFLFLFIHSFTSFKEIHKLCMCVCVYVCEKVKEAKSLSPAAA